MYKSLQIFLKKLKEKILFEYNYLFSNFSVKREVL